MPIVRGARTPARRGLLDGRTRVLEQMQSVCHTTIVQNAWDKGKQLSVHAWIYSLRDGLIRDLKSDVDSAKQISTLYRVDKDLA